MRTDYDAVDDHPHYMQQVDTQHLWQVPDPTISAEAWDPDAELAQMLNTTHGVGLDPAPPLLDSGTRLLDRDARLLDRDTRPPERDTRPRRPVNRRRPQAGAHILGGNPRIITVAVLVAAITVCAVTMLTWSISYSYDQLRSIALLVVSPKLAQWWPLTVYGPWLLAGLSILRASVQRRTARRSWAVMLVSSGVAVALCIGQSPHSLLAMVVVGIPPITALVCFRELVGQFSSRPGPKHAADPVNGSKQTKS
ncbi:hypothetical protein GCM10022233_42070 [Streptomyces shaanxiensis]|uniref:DUF2637 domain-containing protein n=2 Tax=Streptomyces shaanxiensis TaxID=653357 RepID=A0ABP7VBE3_9ACTN